MWSGFFFSSFLIQSNHMDNRKAVLDLKDVPPPPLHHTSSSQLSQPFSLSSLPLPPPCLPPPPPQLAQDSFQQPPPPHQQQEGASPKVSICEHCDHNNTDGFGLLGGRGVVGSGSNAAGVVSLYMAPGSLGAPISTSRSGPCSVASSVHQYKHKFSCGTGGEAFDPLFSLSCKPQLSSSVATSQPISSHPYLPCCSGLLHTYPAVPLSFSQASLFPSSAPMASSLPSVSSLPASLHGSCLTSSGFYTCGVDCSASARRSQGSILGGHPSTSTITTTATSAHFFSNPMHLNVERTVCVKGAHYCQECLFKVGWSLFIKFVWPKDAGIFLQNVELNHVCLSFYRFSYFLLLLFCVFERLEFVPFCSLWMVWWQSPTRCTQVFLFLRLLLFLFLFVMAVAPSPMAKCSCHQPVLARLDRNMVSGVSNAAVQIGNKTELILLTISFQETWVCFKMIALLGSPEGTGPENIPPVGVFWDIENCSVPSGRSAGAVVQRIRNRFFQGHREAEFICVCDISKESKAVIQELNNCQVSVIFKQ